MYIRKELEVTAETFLSNFALRCCLYFTWCNNLFMNNSKVCVLPEISLHIYHAIRPVRKQKLLGWYDVVHILWHVYLHCVLHNILQFSSPVSCRFMDGKVRENVEALFTLFSKYYKFWQFLSICHLPNCGKRKIAAHKLKLYKYWWKILIDR